MPTRGLLLALMFVGLVILGATPTRAGDDCLRPARGVAEGAASLADLGEMALERLPGDYTIVRANLSAERPRAVVACYLMASNLLVVEETGLLYCLDRRDLAPRWVVSLKAPLHSMPAEGPTHYFCLVKAVDGAYWVHAFAKRSGTEAERFPVRLPFAVSSGLAAGGSYAWMGSLGSPGDNRTLESVNVADGRVAWGWRTRGLLWAAPTVDPTGNSLVVAGEDGTVTSLPVGSGAPSGVNWSNRLTGAITATPAITPEHVVVGSHDGLVRCLDLATGNVNWLEGVDAPIRTGPWVLGGTETITRASGVEGAPGIEVDAYLGIAFARNRNGLYAFDLGTGTRLFEDAAARRPICRTGKWVVTIDRNRTLHFRDAEDGYAVKGSLPLGMFDLIPTNSSDGAIYGCTHDGGIVAAVPTP